MTNNKIKINLDSLKARREWKRHKVKDGHNIFRILPPFGEASNGYPYRKWQIVWGLTDPESGRARPFASSLTSEKRCPIAEFTTELKKRAEDMKAKMQAKGFSEDEIRARLKDLNELASNITPKTVYIYNAVDKSGEVGLLELKSTAHKAMKAEMNQYIQDYNQDPTSLGSSDDDSGLWFDITRQGMGRDTEYDVKKCQTKVKNGASVSFVDDRSPLPESVTENYDNLAYDLSAVYQVKTYEQLSEILEFNMPGIIQTVPDADLSVEPAIDSKGGTTSGGTPTKSSPTRPSTPSTSSSKVTLKLDSADDEDEVTLAPASSFAASKKTSRVNLDDDFMAEADAILNG